MNIEVPAAKNRLLFLRPASARDGLQVFMLIITNTDRDATLEIAEFSSDRGTTQS